MLLSLEFCGALLHDFVEDIWICPRILLNFEYFPPPKKKKLKGKRSFQHTGSRMGGVIPHWTPPPPPHPILMLCPWRYCYQQSDSYVNTMEDLHMSLWTNYPHYGGVSVWDQYMYVSSDEGNSLGSRREAFLSQSTDILTEKGVRPFSVKISVLVCVVSHSILLSTKTARYSVIIWPSLWFTSPPSDWLKAELTTDHRAYRKHWQEISELLMPEGLCIKPWADLNLKLFASIDPHHDAVILKLYWGFKSLM